MSPTGQAITQEKMRNQDFKIYRQELHKIAEVSGKEKATAKKVKQWLEDFKPDELITDIGGHGLLAIYKGDAEGPTTLLRCELDALPIHETNGFDHRSETDGVSHKCGHDGHMAIMLAVAEHLSHERIAKGRVLLLFQPAEENGEGAKAVLEDPKFQKFTPDYVFALHNLPGMERGHVFIKKGTYTAAVTSIILKFQGKTSHAAEPENGLNPALAMARTLEKALYYSNNKTDHPDFSVVTPVYSTLGEKAYGISAGEGELHLTLRTWQNDKLEDLCESIEAIAQEESVPSLLDLDISYTQHFEANVNGDAAYDILKSMDCSLERKELQFPFKWGEDFGRFTSRYEGAMIGLGAGSDVPFLHNPDYDFPDEIIPHGRELFSSIIKHLNR